MKNYLFVMVLTALVFSCREPKEKMPDNILSEKKMIDVLIEIHLIEANLSNKNLPKDTGLIYYNLYKKDMYKKFNIDDSTYIKSFNYYAAHPQIMDKIYEKVVDSLSLLEGSQK